MRLAGLLVLLTALALVGASGAAAQGGSFVECADFTPDSVRQACDRAVPIECRGPDAPQDFDACLRAQGTTPEAVNAAIQAAQRAAGIPIGGVDTGLGGAGGRPDPRLILIAAALGLLATMALTRGRSSRE